MLKDSEMWKNKNELKTQFIEIEVPEMKIKRCLLEKGMVKFSAYFHQRTQKLFCGQPTLTANSKLPPDFFNQH